MKKEFRNVLLSFGLVAVVVLASTSLYSRQSAATAIEEAKFAKEMSLSDLALGTVMAERYNKSVSEPVATTTRAEADMLAAKQVAAEAAAAAEAKRQAQLAAQQKVDQLASKQAAQLAAKQQVAQQQMMLQMQMQARRSRAS